jgi:hypothetical protein
MATDPGAETLPVFFMPDGRNAGRPELADSTAEFVPRETWGYSAFVTCSRPFDRTNHPAIVYPE